MPRYLVKADISHLIDDRSTLILDADVAAASGTITVQSILGVTTNNLLLFRGIGNEKSEIVATHASTSPSGNTVTLAANTVEAHPAGTVVYVIGYNQIRFYHSSTEDDANSSDSGLTALAAAAALDPTRHINTYEDTSQTSGYYYYRFIDSVNSVNSLYSDPIPWVQVSPEFGDNEVGSIIEQVRNSLGREWSSIFNKQDAIMEIDKCVRYIQGKFKRWPRYLVPDYAAGQTERLVFDYALPSDIYDDQSNKSILAVRIIGQTSSSVLVPKDEKEFDRLMGDAKYTTVRTQPSTGQNTLEIVNSYDFDSSGTVNVATSNTVDAIDYTGVTRSTTAGVLTGVSTSGSGAIDAAHAVGQNVWQGEEEGVPRYFNVRNGRIRIWPMPNSSWVNFNLFLDYYEEATTVDSESDTIDSDRVDMVEYWLRWKMRSVLENKGKLDLRDGDYLMFRDILTQAIRTSVNNQKHKMAPKINSVVYGRSRIATSDFNRS